MELKMQNVCVSFENWSLDNFSMHAAPQSVTSIVGPSGSGKTTVLRAISGLQEVRSGKIFFDKKDMTNVPAEQRGTGMVFQGDSLFPHLNVFENTAFGLRARKDPKAEKKTLRALSLVGLQGFEKRGIDTLSGGEKKRVAIARAIAFEPKVLLLDEPLNGLDARLKERTRLLLKDLQKKTGATMVFVSHDIDEAFFLGDKIILMNCGKIVQQGNPIDMFLRPKNRFVKEFTSDYVLVQGKTKTINGKKVVEGKFSFNSKEGKGTAFFNLKKNSYKFVEK